jgi:hypothetical protein
MSFLIEAGPPYKLTPGSFLRKAGVLILAGGLIVSCGHGSEEVSGPIRQNAYLWQREWTPAVIDSLVEAEGRVDGIVVLGAEIVWVNKKPEVIEASIAWDRLSRFTKPVSLALRVAPYPGPFDANGSAAKTITATASKLLEKARASGVKVTAFQIDFDCAQKNLSGYRVWLALVRSAVQRVPLIVTTLPAWLDEPEFARLIGEVDGYVLQVHSVPPANQNGPAVLCDAASARRWVRKANRLGIPFSVALPTYRCVAGYDETGKLLSVAMDSVQQSWPPGTRAVEFATDANQVAALINEWKTKRPALLRDLFWYRLPVATDERNWRWTTLSAVMAGRAPLHKLVVRSHGENPVDLAIANVGEADEQGDLTVTVAWSNDSSIIASDALPGWSVAVARQRAIFKPEAGVQLRLSPGATRSIGWLRYDRPPNFHAQVEESAVSSR